MVSKPRLFNLKYSGVKKDQSREIEASSTSDFRKESPLERTIFCVEMTEEPDEDVFSAEAEPDFLSASASKSEFDAGRKRLVQK